MAEIREVSGGYDHYATVVSEDLSDGVCDCVEGVRLVRRSLGCPLDEVGREAIPVLDHESVPAAGARGQPRVGYARHCVRAECLACLVTYFSLLLTRVGFERGTHEMRDVVGRVA